MATVLAKGVGVAASGDIAIPAGTTAVIFLSTDSGVVPQDALVFIEQKDSGGQYTPVAQLDAWTPGGIINGSANPYRFRRAPTQASVGVEQG